MTHKIQRYGWLKDSLDQRDVCYLAPPKRLPPKIDLRPYCPDVYDQGELGSCTGNAIAGAVEFEMMKQKMPGITPSRLFIYYNERVIENTIQSDSGAQIRDGIKSVASQGVCPETEWPYDITKFADKPPDGCYTDALHDKVLQYSAVNQSLSQMKGCLADGYPFVLGFTVYESFESQQVADTGIVPLPKKNDQPVGGHAVMCVGYDDSQKKFIVRNSWGDSWGCRGYFFIPYTYLTNTSLVSDLWTIRMVEL